MYKLILKVTLIISLLLNSAGQGYALRPMAFRKGDMDDLLASFGMDKIFIDKEKVEKWKKLLRAELESLRVGNKGRYPQKVYIG